MSLSKVLQQKAKERQLEANYSSVYNITISENSHGRMEPYWTTPITVTFNLQLKR